MNLPYSFEPLFDLLEKLDMTPDDLVSKKILSRSTVEKILSGQQVMLATAAKICVSLGCDFDDIIELKYDYDPAETIDDGTQNYKPWSEEEERILIEEYQNMASLNEIAKKLNRSAGAIGSRIGRLVFAGKMTKRNEKNTPKTEGEAKTLQRTPKSSEEEWREKYAPKGDDRLPPDVIRRNMTKDYGAAHVMGDPDTSVVFGD